MPHDPVTTDLEIIIGESKTYLLIVSDKNGNLDLTGHEIRLTIKRSVDEQQDIIEKSSTTPAEITFLTPQADADKKGRANVFILPAETKTLDKDTTYVLDAWIILSGGERKRILETRNVVPVQPVTVIA